MSMPRPQSENGQAGGHRWRIDSQAIDTLTQYVRAAAYLHRYMNFDQIPEFVEQAATVEM